MEQDRPKVGVAAIVIKEGKVLVGRRMKEGRSKGKWLFPGGHLEFGESIEGCAERETMEEAMVKIGSIKIVAVTNDVFRYETNPKHYITIFVTASYMGGEPKDTAEAIDWRWSRWDELPKPLFLSVENLLKQGFNPFSEKAL
jgi:8-oxo-dGTP diphosphatase